VNQGILSHNDNFLFPKSSNDSAILRGNESSPSIVAREGVPKIGRFEFYQQDIFGLNLGFNFYNSISGNSTEYLNPAMTSSVGIIRENLEGSSQIRYTGVIPGGASGLCYEYFSNNYTPLSIISYLKSSDYNWNPDKLCLVVDTTKNPEGLYFRSIPLMNISNEAVTIDWGDDSSLDVLFLNSLSSGPHLYRKHGIYIIQITATGPSNAPLFGATKTTNQSVIGILSYGNSPYINGYRNITEGKSGSTTPNILFFPNKLPANIETLSSLFINRRLLTSFFPSKVDKIDYNNCESWDTSNIKNFLNTFNTCSIRETNLSKWNTSGVISFQGMFDGSRLYKGNGLDFWNVGNATTFTNMFQACPLFNCNLGNWNTSNATAMNNMFNGCSNFRGDGLENWNTSNVTTMVGMFNNCSVFNANLSGWNTSKITSAGSMFNGCVNFRGSGLENWNTSNITSMTNMFSSCNVFNANLSGWNTNNISNMEAIFFNNLLFIGSGLNSWSPKLLGGNSSVFQGCTRLGSGISLNLSNWSVTGATSMTSFFSSCINITGIIISGWSPASGCNMQNMFISSNLSSGYLPNWRFGTNNLCEGFFNSARMTAVSGLNTWNTSGITNMQNMFVNSINFNDNLSGWNTSNVTTMNGMFNNCASFSGSGLENWNLSRLNSSTSLTNFAAGCNFPTNQYDLILNTWNNNKSSGVNGIGNWRTDLNVHFGNSSFSSAGSGARTALRQYGWTITDASGTGGPIV